MVYVYGDFWRVALVQKTPAAVLTSRYRRCNYVQVLSFSAPFFLSNTLVILELRH